MSDIDLQLEDLREELARIDRDRASWLNAYNLKAAELRAVAAALSFDPAEDRDLETCARRIYAMRVYANPPIKPL